MRGKEEVKGVAEHRKWLHRKSQHLHIGDESSPEQGLQTDPHGGLKMGETKNRAKGQVSLKECQHIPHRQQW